MKITISWGRNDPFDSRSKFHKEDLFSFEGFEYCEEY